MGNFCIINLTKAQSCCKLKAFQIVFEAFQIAGTIHVVCDEESQAGDAGRCSEGGRVVSGYGLDSFEHAREELSDRTQDA